MYLKKHVLTKVVEISRYSLALGIIIPVRAEVNLGVDCTLALFPDPS